MPPAASVARRDSSSAVNTQVSGKVTAWPWNSWSGWVSSFVIPCLQLYSRMNRSVFPVFTREISWVSARPRSSRKWDSGQDQRQPIGLPVGKRPLLAFLGFPTGATLALRNAPFVQRRLLRGMPVAPCVAPRRFNAVFIMGVIPGTIASDQPILRARSFFDRNAVAPDVPQCRKCHSLLRRAQGTAV